MWSSNHISVAEYLFVKLQLSALDHSTFASLPSVFLQAAIDGRVEMLRFLYERSGDRTKAILRAETPLLSAQNPDVTSFLWSILTAQERTACKDLGAKVFCAASNSGNLQEVKEWYERVGKTAKAGLLAHNDCSAFRLAACGGHTNVVKYLWSHASIREKQSMMKAVNFHAFVGACGNGHVETAQYLARVNETAANSPFFHDFGCYAFSCAAKNNQRSMAEYIYSNYETPKRRKELLSFDKFLVLKCAIRGKHWDMLIYLLKLCAHSKVVLQQEVAAELTIFHVVVEFGSMQMLQYWYSHVLTDELSRQSALQSGNWEPFIAAARTQSIDLLRFLLHCVSDAQQCKEMLVARGGYAFQIAVERRDMNMARFLCESVAPTDLPILLTKERLITAVERDCLPMVDYFHQLCPPERWQEMVRHDGFRVFVRAMSRNLFHIATFFMTHSAQCFSHAERHAHEYDRVITINFVNGMHRDLQSRQRAYELSNPNGVFDVQHAEEAALCFYLIKFELNRVPTRAFHADRMTFLLSLPSVRALAHISMTPSAPRNELLRAAEGNAWAYQLLLSIPAVAALEPVYLIATNNPRPTNRPPRTPFRRTGEERNSVAALAADRESSMVGLTSTEEQQLEAVKCAYAPAGLHRLTLSPLLAELERQYAANPARIKVRTEDLKIPMTWVEFGKFTSVLPSTQRASALQALYEHKIHTALRYLSNPNPWLHERADYLPMGQRCSSFQDYIPLIAVLYAAASDTKAPGTEGFTVETRVEQFIAELALIGRAHNWDKSRARSGRPGQLEEYDDLEGDRPSCYSGVKRRLFQSVHGHPLLRTVTGEVIREELRGFTREHFARSITPALKALWDSYVIDLDYDGLIGLDVLNVPQEMQTALVAQLTVKYGTHMAVSITQHVADYFKLNAPHRNHAEKLGGTTDLNGLFEQMSVAA